MKSSATPLARLVGSLFRFRHSRLSAICLMILIVPGLIVVKALSERLILGRVFAGATATNPSRQTRARLSDAITVYAAGRGKPYINFEDGHDVLTGYDAASASASEVSANTAKPLAMASADFDEDGVPDLVSGYSTSGAGMLTLHRGNVDSIYPNAPEAQQRKAPGLFPEAPFLSPARMIDLPQAADFVGAGDFDADGHWDVVTATRGENALQFLAGDGKGKFGSAQRIELPGRVTAMATGEVNRADGLTDVVVGVATSSGAKALVFESPQGALRGKAESFDLRDEATAIAIGNLDAEYTMDIAIASERELMVINGRDRKLSLDENRQATVPKARTSRRAFSFGLKSVVIGDFKGDHSVGLAVLTDQGSVRLLTAVSAKAKKKGIKKWTDEAWASGSWAQATQMVRARVSSVPSDDLVIVDGLGHKLHIVAKAAPSQQQQANGLQSVSFDVEDEPMAVMPMRLNSDALSDLVILRNGQVGPTAMTSQPVLIFTVTTNQDNVAGSLRAAIDQANTNPGQDTINFQIGTGPQTITPTSPLPTITDALVIDGTTQPGFAGSPLIELNGANAGNSDGLFISAGSSIVRALVVNRFDGNGIVFNVNGNNLVEGNFIGTDLNGTSDLGNSGSGIAVFNASSSNTIGGMTNLARNVISGNGNEGVSINNAGATGNQVQGNFIGTDSSGTVAIPNIFAGVFINGSNGHTIGGTVAGARNVISGGADRGVTIIGDGNFTQGNFIGTDASSTTDLGNTLGGMLIVGSNNVIGGIAEGAGNVISGNDFDGVEVAGAGSGNNLIQGNFIGTDINGTADLGNERQGVLIDLAAANNTVGGTVAGARNVISGNDNDGVQIASAGTSNNTVQGNFIGTDVSGTADLGNGRLGVLISAAATNNIVGGTIAGARNVISGNQSVGVQIANAGTSNNIVQGNFIGTDVTGTVDLGNSSMGVVINLDATNNTVGGTTSAARNIIAFNSLAGVRVGLGATENAVLSNSIFSNGALGIDLDPAGVTPNDAGDTDAGANNLQNFPMLAAISSGGATVIQGTLNSTPNTSFTIQFFSNNDCDASGFGEGETFLGSIQRNTDNTGNASFTFSTDATVNPFITATATDPSGNTSEFSQCAQVGEASADLQINKSASPNPVKVGATLTYTIAVTNKGPNAADSVRVTDALPDSLTFVSCVSSAGGFCAGSGNDRRVSFVSLAPGATATITFVATVKSSVTNGTNISNTAVVSSSTNDPVSANNTATLLTLVSDTALGITCPTVPPVTAGQGQTSAVVTYPNPTVNDNRTGVTIVCAPPSGSAFPVGTTMVNCTATDQAEGQATCSFSVTVNLATPPMPVPDKTAVDFGAPIVAPSQNPPSDTFTLTNTTAISADVTLASISRTGSDVANGKITNTDDSGLFTITAQGSTTPLTPGSIITIGAGQTRSFLIVFNPSIPAVAQRNTNLSADQVLPDVVTSNLTFTQNGGGSTTIGLTGRVATALRLIDPVNPDNAAVVTFTRSGNQFTLTYSVFDSNLDVSRATYQFQESGGQPVGPELEVNLAQAVAGVSLVRGQSFTVEQPFAGANSHPEVSSVRVTVFDGETSVTATANLGSSAASVAREGDGTQRVTVRLTRLRMRRFSP